MERYELVSKEYMWKKKDLARKEKIDEIPKRGNYRMWAHCNVLNDTAFPFPLNYQFCDWEKNYPKFYNSKNENLYLNTRSHPVKYDKKIK